MLLNGINHLALISGDVERLGDFYRGVFDAEVGPTKPHGDDGGETMTVIAIGPHTELNVVTIDGNHEPDRQTPMWGRGRIDHFGLQAATTGAFETIRQRLVARGASDGAVNDFGAVLSVFFRDPDGLEGEVLVQKPARTDDSV
ncbi:VOC family protein [Williamsia sterculiae]|uniref:Catechol 2,3-dioxygenase n=1 Tax=Williamsia sterculiae TaxID=1344003 RepID=A0A1N7FWF3_9NOCA|nr:VOC family protein [Williamsia sterculiae]SIS04678.1 Catechol 2,3-dioxygenase [Williamsia sterculiae]